MSMSELEARCLTNGVLQDALSDFNADDRIAIIRAVLAEAGVAELVEAAKRSLQGWENAVELGLIPHRHTNTATILADELRAYLTQEQPR